jgi:hypothetical protein
VDKARLSKQLGRIGPETLSAVLAALVEAFTE